MTQDDIIEMAKQAGFTDADENGVWITGGFWTEEIEALIKLIEQSAAAKEREKCAEVAERINVYDHTIAAAIRARGQGTPERGQA